MDRNELKYNLTLPKDLCFRFWGWMIIWSSFGSRPKAQTQNLTKTKFKMSAPRYLTDHVVCFDGFFTHGRFNKKNTKK